MLVIFVNNLKLMNIFFKVFRPYFFGIYSLFEYMLDDNFLIFFKNSVE